VKNFDIRMLFITIMACTLTLSILLLLVATKFYEITHAEPPTFINSEQTFICKPMEK